MSKLRPPFHPTFAVAALAATLAGCADLVVTQNQVVWNADVKVATATVRNQGWIASGPTALYFDGDEQPESPNYRPQVQAELPALSRGQSVTRLADFAPLARPENAFLANVRSITVRADPKNLVRELNEGNNVATRSVAASAATCIDFDALAAGTVFGSPVPQPPGTVVITQGPVRVSIENFRWTNGGTGYNRAQVAPATAGFGSGQVLRVNNINLDFDFSAVSPPVSEVTFRWGDQGGFENLGVNGVPQPIYAGELLSAPSPIGGALVTSASTPMPGGRKGVTAVLQPGGGIGRLRVGGQEFLLDDVCFR